MVELAFSMAFILARDAQAVDGGEDRLVGEWNGRVM